MANAKEYFKNKRDELYSEEYRTNLKKHRKKSLGIVIGCIVALIAVFIGIYYYNVHRVYDGYDVVSEAKRQDSTSSEYVMMSDYIIRYGMDGVSCYDENHQVIWNESYEMKHPIVDVSGEYMAICDTDGTKFYIMNADGLAGEVDTQLPIKDIEVAAQGTVAVLLEEGEVNRINYYDRNGTLLAENKSPIEKSGFPMDISLSSDGLKMAVSYMTLETGTIKTKVAFYNFDKVGANEIDHLVSAKEYEEAVVPQIEFVNGTTAIIFGDSFFDIFQGSEKPEEIFEQEIDKEITAVFYDDAYFGLITKEMGAKPYCLKVYDLNGKKKMSLDLTMEYDRVKIVNERVYLMDSTQCVIYNLQGTMKFKGAFEGLKDVLPLDEDNLLVVLEGKVQTVKLT